VGSLKKPSTPDSVVVGDSQLAERSMLGRKERDQLEFFITGSLRQLIPDQHVLARVDRILDLSWLREESLIVIARRWVGPGSIPRWRYG
jgi:hypothetical protein